MGVIDVGSISEILKVGKRGLFQKDGKVLLSKLNNKRVGLNNKRGDIFRSIRVAITDSVSVSHVTLRRIRLRKGLDNFRRIKVGIDSFLNRVLTRNFIIRVFLQEIICP